MTTVLSILVAACGLILATAAAADEKRSWELDVGVAVAKAPDYSGASASSPRLKIWADGTYRTQDMGTFALDSGSLTIAPEIRWDVVDAAETSFGPLVGYRSGRNDHNPGFASADDGSSRLHGLPNVKGAIDAGVGGHLTVFGVPLFAQARAALGGQQGVLVNLGVYLPLAPTPDLELTILPTVAWANLRQMRAFYGVSQSAATASGFAPFDPGSGWENVAVEIGGDWRAFGDWHVIASLAYQRLLGPAARSPIVQTASQPSALIGLVLHF